MMNGRVYIKCRNYIFACISSATLEFLTDSMYSMSLLISQRDILNVELPINVLPSK